MPRFALLTLALILGLTPALRAETKLSRAAIAGKVSKMKACLDDGEKVDDIDKWGWTALMWAVYYRHDEATKFLLEQKANPNIQSTLVYASFPVKTTPLHIAVYYGLEDPTKLLLKAGADKELVNEKGKKPLDLAREFNFEAIAELLTGKPEKAEEPPPAPKPKPKPAPQPKPVPKPEPVQPSEPTPAPEPAVKTEKAIKAEPAKPAPAPVKPEPAPEPAPVSTPVQEAPAPKKPAPVKKPETKKPAPPRKSEPPAIK